MSALVHEAGHAGVRPVMALTMAELVAEGTDRAGEAWELLTEAVADAEAPAAAGGAALGRSVKGLLHALQLVASSIAAVKLAMSLRQLWRSGHWRDRLLAEVEAALDAALAGLEGQRGEGGMVDFEAECGRLEAFQQSITALHRHPLLQPRARPHAHVSLAQASVAMSSSALFRVLSPLALLTVVTGLAETALDAVVEYRLWHVQDLLQQLSTVARFAHRPQRYGEELRRIREAVRRLRVDEFLEARGTAVVESVSPHLGLSPAPARRRAAADEPLRLGCNGRIQLPAAAGPSTVRAYPGDV